MTDAPAAPELQLLAERIGADSPRLDAALDAALAWLDAELGEIAAALQVEYLGPQVGMADMDAEHVYRLAIREHGWDALTRVWGLKVCDALENCDLRPMWPIQGVGRLRKHQVLETLPECLRGYLQAVRAAGLQDRAEAQRLAALSAALSAPA